MKLRAIAFSMLLLVSLSFGVGAVPAAAANSAGNTNVDVATSDLAGNGTDADPYVVTNASELQAMEDDREAHYELGNDIDASGTEHWNDGAGFAPVGDIGSGNTFTGTLDGDRHTIDGLRINRSNAEYVGLFGAVSSGRVTDLRLTDVNVTADRKAGTLSGWANYVHVDNVSVSGNVTADADYVGGLVGDHEGNGDGTSYINDSSADVNVTGTTDVGGLVGTNYAGEIRNVSSQGTVTGTNDVGGVAGEHVGNGSGDTALLLGSSSSATVDVSGDGGGLVGEVDESVVRNSSASGRVDCYDDGGGLAGVIIDGSTVVDSSANGAVRCDRDSSATSGGFVGLLVNSEVRNASATGTVEGDEDLGGFAGEIDNGIVHNASASGFVDGLGSQAAEAGGFVGEVRNGAIVTNSSASENVEVAFGGLSVGGFAGFVQKSSVRYSTASGDVNSSSPAGGFVGTLAGSSAEVVRSYATGSVDGDEYVGGFAGALSGSSTEVVRSYATGSVDGDENVGGFVWQSSGTIDESFAVGPTSGSSNVSGFVGNNLGTVTDSYWDTATTGQAASDGGTGLTTAEMTDVAARSNMSFAFGDRWGARANDYPALAWQDVNTLPVASDDSYTTDEDTDLSVARPSGVLTNDYDVDGDTLTATVTSNVSHGALALDSDGVVFYTPDSDYNGADSFTYRVTDDNGRTDTATVSLTVNAVNDAPMAGNDSYTTDEDTTLTVSPSAGVLSNDTDVEGDSLSVTPVSRPSNGTLSFAANGSFEYTPDSNYNGADSFTYEVTDGNGGTDTGTVSLNVTPVNDAPTATNNSYTTEKNTTLSVSAENGTLANDTDIEGDTLAPTVTSNVSHGTLSFAANGSFEYVPDANYNGSDSFTYEVTDGHGGTDTATVSLTVTPVNDTPVATDDAYTTDKGVTLTVSAANGVLANDNDVEHSLSVSVVSTTTSGSLSLASNGSIEYAPNADFTGTDSFSYEVSDGDGGTDTATVTISVEGSSDSGGNGENIQYGGGGGDDDSVTTDPVEADETDGSSGGAVPIPPYGIPDTRSERRVTDAAPNESGTTVRFENTSGVRSVDFDRTASNGTVVVAEYDGLPDSIADDVQRNASELSSVADGATVDGVALITTSTNATTESTTATITLDGERFDTSSETVVLRETADGWDPVDGGNKTVMSAETNATTRTAFAVVSVPQSADTATPTESVDPSPTDQPYGEVDDTETKTDEEASVETTRGSGPSLGVVLAVLAVMAAAAVGVRRRD